MANETEKTKTRDAASGSRQEPVVSSQFKCQHRTPVGFECFLCKKEEDDRREWQSHVNAIVKRAREFDW